MQYSSEFLLNELLTGLATLTPCDSREQAYAEIRQRWLQVNERNGLPARQIAQIRMRELGPEHGWENLHADPCHVDSMLAPFVRLNLHQNGAIVIQQMNHATPHILFALPGSHKATQTPAR